MDLAHENTIDQTDGLIALNMLIVEEEAEVP
jgi:hypothetical protein